MIPIDIIENARSNNINATCTIHNNNNANLYSALGKQHVLSTTLYTGSWIR